MEDHNLHKELFDDPPQSDSGGIQHKKFLRSKNNVVIAGVCAGISEYLGTDPANIRLLAILSLLLGYWPAIVYLIMAFLIPIDLLSEPLPQYKIARQIKENFRTVLSGIFILIGLHYSLIELGLRRAYSLIILPNGFMFPFLAIAAGMFLLTNRIYQFKNGSIPITFFRTRKDRWLFGVCGGLAKYLDIDVASLRIIFLLLTALTLGLFSISYIFFVVTTTTEFESIPLCDE